MRAAGYFTTLNLPSGSRSMRPMPSRTERLRWAFAALLIAAAVTCSARPASACPGCAAASAARAEIFGEAFFRNLAVAALPFVIIGAVCARVQRLGRP
jgi:hypothetical protein